jgi:hypothetical protein
VKRVKVCSFTKVFMAAGGSVTDPGCLSRIPDPVFCPSRIPDPKTAAKEKGGKKLLTFFYKYNKIKNI